MTEAEQICQGCAAGGECLLVDGLIVTVLDILERYRGTETTATGLDLIIRGELTQWHNCAPGRRRLETLLRTSATDGTTADGLRLLLRRSLDAPHST